MTALDMVYRSYGVLKYARKVTLNDGELLLSQIRFGLASGLIKADGFDESNIYQLMIGIHPANLLMISDKDMDEEELEIARADFIREHLHIERVTKCRADLPVKRRKHLITRQIQRLC